MSVWTYSDALASRESILHAIALICCPFCSSGLECLKDGKDNTQPAQGVELETKIVVRACPVCGWWVSSREEFTRLPHNVRAPKQAHPLMKFASNEAPPPHELRVFGAAACLKQLSLSDLSVPIDEIRDYLAAKYDARFQVHPKKFEEVVASVFRDLGYRSRVTAYSGDDGIDIILDSPQGDVIGVQVKRYEGSIEVEQIRSLAGALVLNGMTKGIFVTTSLFQSGAERTVRGFQERGVPIQLIDAPRFLESLNIAQRKRYQTRSDEGAPFLVAAEKFLTSSSHPLFNSAFFRRTGGEASDW